MFEPRTGQLLRDDLKNLTITRKPIVDEFIFERDIFLFSGDSGIGKSSIILQIAYEMASCPTVLEHLKVHKNVKVLYLQLEGDYEESIERLRGLTTCSGMEVNTDNFCIYELKNFECADKEQRERLVDFFADFNFKPEVVVIDPIYKLTTKDISKPEGAIAIVEFSDFIQTKWDCSNILVHHNTKNTFDIIGGKKVQKGDSYYGHSFLKNHVRTSYALRQGDGKKYAPMMTRKKGRGSDTIAKLDLLFNAEYGYTTANETHSKCEDKFIEIATRLKKTAKTTTFNEFAELSGISEAQLKRIKKTDLFSAYFQAEPSGQKRMQKWKVLK